MVETKGAAVPCVLSPNPSGWSCSVLRALFLFLLHAGVLYEVFLEVVVYRWGFTNRGVLLGPYCRCTASALVFLLAFSRLMAKREQRGSAG